MQFTLYPIHWIAGPGDREPFDVKQLPFDIVEGVRIEAVHQRFRPGAFELSRKYLGEEISKVMERVHYALVHRFEFEPPVSTVEGRPIVIGAGGDEQSRKSEELVKQVVACLRLIRPMREHALVMRGTVRPEDGSFDVTSFEVPSLALREVPPVQRLFMLRNCDANALRTYAAEFLRAMRGDFWKFRMALQFHELGFFQTFDWKARYSLWCSAIESIYTSHNLQHQGSLVATSRIKWFLGQNTNIYAPGDLTEWEKDPNITLGDIVAALYNVRNFMAHGDRIPDYYFHTVVRKGLSDDIVALDVLLEAASFIIRTSLLKILRDGLLHHFAEASTAETFFGAQGLTKNALKAARKKSAMKP